MTRFITADTVLNNNNIKSVPTFQDIGNIAKNYSAIICNKWESQHMDKSGYAEKIEDGFRIWINPTHSPQRQKFTLAHEICHIINDMSHTSMMEDENIHFIARDGKNNDMEYRANKFAGEMLMPRRHMIENVNMILNALGDGEKISRIKLTEKMAKIFDVSMDSMRVRLTVLRII